jgi:hypothetical protein
MTPPDNDDDDINAYHRYMIPCALGKSFTLEVKPFRLDLKWIQVLNLKKKLPVTAMMMACASASLLLWLPLVAAYHVRTDKRPCQD